MKCSASGGTPQANQERPYTPPSLIPLFSTDIDQPDGLIDANSYNVLIASSLSLTRE